MALVRLLILLSMCSAQSSTLSATSLENCTCSEYEAHRGVSLSISSIPSLKFQVPTIRHLPKPCTTIRNVETLHTRVLWTLRVLLDFLGPPCQTSSRKTTAGEDSRTTSSKACRAVPARYQHPPQYPSRYPNYHLIQTIRSLIEVYWGV